MPTSLTFIFNRRSNFTNGRCEDKVKYDKCECWTSLYRSRPDNTGYRYSKNIARCRTLARYDECIDASLKSMQYISVYGNIEKF